MSAGGQVLRGRLQLGYLLHGPEFGAHPNVEPLAVPLSARLSWCCADPWLVSVAFLTAPGTEVWWGIGRELLQAGVRYPAGLGDVSVLPDPTDPRYAELALSTDDGRCALRFAVDELGLFLDRVTAHLAQHRGHEQVPRDDELSAMLGSGRE